MKVPDGLNTLTIDVIDNPALFSGIDVKGYICGKDDLGIYDEY